MRRCGFLLIGQIQMKQKINQFLRLGKDVPPGNPINIQRRMRARDAEMQPPNLTERIS